MGETDVITSIVSAKQNMRNVLNGYLVPSKGDETKDSKRMADGLAAVEVIVSIINLFDTLNAPNKISTTTAIVDLTYGLNRNHFWLANAGYLMPLITAGINAMADYTEAKQEQLWDKLQYHNKHAWLEAIPAVVFCLLGPTEMRRLSDEMKKWALGCIK